ncbi:TPA: glycosyl transferase family 1 [Patescibacteria group bacterium]|jgi:glycosyltransferase involved in cell wall biosynthesis|nr:glycosyl transferase family 1 [Patescibacteria group bacterium]
MAESKTPLIACLSTYPPRECGIATFSQDLVTAYNNLFSPHNAMGVVAMHNDTVDSKYPVEVLFTIDQQDQQSYIKAADRLNSDEQILLVNIQHEFGIFGGDWGEYLEIFLQRINKPVITTLHTVLPNPDQKVIGRMNVLVKYSAELVVMTERSKQILLSDYKVRASKITIIPHGIHPQLYHSSDEAKKELNLPNVPMLTTFGLLSEGKGIEYILQALPEVVKKYPEVQYFLIGKTHPGVVKQEGERYRDSLWQLVQQLGLQKNVKFIDRYFDVPELLQYLQATDIYISGSLNPNQAVSGTLTYAMGVGRPVVATEFSQAKEVVTNETGILVPFRDPPAYANALIGLLDNAELRKHLGKNAYFQTRHMTWPNVALAYSKSFAAKAPEVGSQHKSIPPIKLDHVTALTDDFGIFQFAQLHVRNPQSGYTLDDNARALMVVTKYYQKSQDQEALRLLQIYLNFIEAAAIGNGEFRNYFTVQRKFDEAANLRDSLEDSNARCLQALMWVWGADLVPKELREQARKLYRPGLVNEFRSPRAAAFFIKGMYSLRKQAGIPEKIRRHCDFLVGGYEANRSEGWEWFEPQLTYSNALIPEALLLGYLATKQDRFLEVGKKTLDFLIEQTFVEGRYVGIGQDGWFAKGGKKATFDQQPEDPAAMVHALKTMYRISKDAKYKKLMYVAFNWFIGDNVLGQFVYDSVTGGSYDGISENQTNLNQGAESTLSYLSARLLM